MSNDDSLPSDTGLTLVVQKRPVGRPKGVKTGQGKVKPLTERKIAYGFGGTTPVHGGPQKSKPWRDAINRAIAQADGKVLRKLADALVKKASEGDVAALKEIGDRLDGRSVQAVEQKVDATIVVRTEDADL